MAAIEPSLSSWRDVEARSDLERFSRSPRPGLHKERVIKGGSFATSLWRAMVDARPSADQDLRCPSVGFRLVPPALTSAFAPGPVRGQNCDFRGPAEDGTTCRDAS